MKIVIINGPNLNLLGRREVSIYGTKTMEQVLVDIQRAYPDVYLEYRQSNHEGDLIDWIQEVGQPTPTPSLKGRELKKRLCSRCCHSLSRLFIPKEYAK